MTRRLFALTLVLALGAMACGDGGTTGDASPSPTTTSSPAATGPQSLTVDVDGVIEGSNVALLGYFPSEVTARQGDTVEFAFQPGDPHTVTFGTLIDEAMAAFAQADQEGPPPEAAEKIPFAISEDGQRVIHAGALPCFTTDEPPTDGSPCEQVDQPAFDGAYAFYNSGLLTPTESFSMEIADDAAPGTYSFLCLLHGPDMSGSLTVVKADASAPTPEEVQAAGDDKLRSLVEEVRPALEAQPTGTLPGFEEALPQGEDQVLAGGVVEGEVPVDILQFGPPEVSIAAGESLTWTVLGFHTISFNAPQDATPPIIVGEDGLPALNPLAFAPQGGAAGAPPPPEGDGPPAEEGPPGPPTVIDGGAWDGSGFFSSGVLPSFPPNLLAYRIAFNTPGTYSYVCLIHPDMEGTVTVR
ncbi:MAG: hypothetical protein M3O70_18220 [Actinomycetota bacterium]|nr:hypothetical protein [Actinomycetota bacterium]